MRCGNDVVQLEQRRVCAWFGHIDIKASASNSARLQSVVEGDLVDNSPTGRIDYVHRRLDLGQRIDANQPRGLLGLRQVHRDEIALLKELVQLDQSYAQLSRALWRQVRVVGDDLHAEALHPVSDKLSDSAQANNT
ncbi:hypothetical protein GALL_471000 [mine drainage metagenome]|uniref:Uncharacterized protein n=1 Tax=mine drainage metagenome TaxID=410659 RepID=A0A1J5PUL4_9ZZZZ